MKKESCSLLARFGILLTSGCLLVATCGEAFAQDRRLSQRHINRPGVTKDAIRHQQAKRAYVAGAMAQHRRERARDRYEDRIRSERYYADRHHHHRDDDNDNDQLTSVLIGVAVGAVATGIIMKNNENNDR